MVITKNRWASLNFPIFREFRICIQCTAYQNRAVSCSVQVLAFTEVVSGPVATTEAGIQPEPYATATTSLMLKTFRLTTSKGVRHSYHTGLGYQKH